MDIKTGDHAMTEKGIYLRQLNEAFARNDVASILESVTDDIRWNVVGDKIVEGKDAFHKILEQMAADEPMILTVSKIITHGREASVNGTMRTPDGKTYAFCDLYSFNGQKNLKIREMTSYVIELKE
jgi:hypothetical protein